MLKLNPYAKTARRHAILKHDPEVGHSAETETEFTAFVGRDVKVSFPSSQIKAKMLKSKKKPKKKGAAAKPKA